MADEDIIPDVIRVSPEFVLEVTYENKVQVVLGNKLTPTQVKNPPVALYWKADPKAFYVLCMTDPDAPSRLDPIWREWHHWLVGNIPGNHVDKGDVLSEYIGAFPANGTGHLRRLYFSISKVLILFYEICTFAGILLQPGNKRVDKRSTAGRANFKITKFAEKYKLGVPMAGNFFTAQYDDNVTSLYEQMLGE